jgi:hypothetical protein
MALKEAHKYSTGKAVATWLVPILILVVIAIIIGIAVLSFLFGAFADNIPSMM